MLRLDNLFDALKIRRAIRENDVRQAFPLATAKKETLPKDEIQNNDLKDSTIYNPSTERRG